MTPSDIDIIPVKTVEHIERLARLAAQIWRQHFTPIIGEAQVRYMLKHFQSAEAIQRQIEFEGVKYFSAQVGDKQIGYMALIPNAEQNKVMLSKLYLAADFRGMGIGKALLNHAEQLTAEWGLSALWLTVNRDNHQTIDWYQRQDFIAVDEQQKNIGGGFIMDDFIMEKPLG